MGAKLDNDDSTYGLIRSLRKQSTDSRWTAVATALHHSNKTVFVRDLLSTVSMVGVLCPIGSPDTDGAVWGRERWTSRARGSVGGVLRGRAAGVHCVFAPRGKTE